MRIQNNVPILIRASVDSGTLPNIMYALECCEAAMIYTAVPLLEDAQTGQIVTNSDGEQLRFFSYLPRKST